MKQNLPELYAIQNHEGKWFTSFKWGKHWTDDVKKAKIFPKIGTARSRISYFANTWPSLPFPRIIRFVIKGIEYIDEKERIKKQQLAKHQKNLRRIEGIKKYNIGLAEREFIKAKEKLEQIKENNV